MSTKKQAVLGMVIVAAALALFLPGLSVAGSLDPPAPPAPTMKTLDQIPPTWSQKLQCDITACPRFQIVLDGYGVLDKETGLVWEQSPSTSTENWGGAHIHCIHYVSSGNRFGWRLPTIQELSSLLDPTQFSPSLPSGHPFSNVQSSYYWSATSNLGTGSAFYTYFFNYGWVSYDDKTVGHYVWCVRGGSGLEVQ